MGGLIDAVDQSKGHMELFWACRPHSHRSGNPWLCHASASTAPAACLPDARIRLYRFSGGLVDVTPDEGVESSRHLSGPLRARPRAPNHTLDFSGPPKTTTKGLLQSGL
jgi:hypothetical protein